MNPAEATLAQIKGILRRIAETRRILPERELAVTLRRLEALVEELELTVDSQRPSVVARIVLFCCVCTRMCIDLLHTRFLLQGKKGSEVWLKPFGELMCRVRIVAARVVERLEAGNSGLLNQTKLYLESMTFRQNLGVKLDEGLDATVDLLEKDLEKDVHENLGGHPEEGGRIALMQPSQEVSDLEELQLPASDTEAVTALFFLWKTIRVLRHKLLFAAVEMSHEAGPWLESIQDHLKINENSTDLAVELEKESHHPELAPWADLTSRVLEQVQISVGLGLRRISSRAEARGPLSSLRTDQTEVHAQIHNLARIALQAYADLQGIEAKIAPAVRTHLHGMDEEWEDCAVKQEDLAECVRSITEADTASKMSVKELADWIDAVLLQGWALPPPLECPESVALVIFRHLAEREPREASAYIHRFLALHTAKGILEEQVAMMFCGALFRIAKTRRGDLPRWRQWEESAVSVASKELASHYSSAGRVAVTAALMSLSIQVAEDVASMASRLHTSLWLLHEELRATIPHADHVKVGYFANHLVLNLQSWPWGENSPMKGLVDSIAKSGIQPPKPAEDELVEKHDLCGV